jgi:sulfite reductase (NADPH) hemoprotein beta-component
MTAATTADPACLPRFSQTSDIEEFVAVLERFEKGELDADAWRKFRLVRGTYGQRQEGVQMQRVKIPLGYMVAS